MSENNFGDHTIGEDLLDCAAQVAEDIDSVESYSEVISLIADRYVELGLPDAAAALAETITDPYRRDQALAKIAAKYTELGDPDAADQLIEMIEDLGLYGLAMEQRAVKYVEAGAFDQAVEVAHELADSNSTLGRIALIHLDQGRFDQAIELAHSIDDPDLKAAILSQIAAGEIQSGRHDEAAQLLLEATAVAEEIEVSPEQIQAFTEIAALYQELGQDARALEILSRAAQLGDEFEGTTNLGLDESFDWDETLALLARSFAQLGRYDQADLLIEEIENPFQVASALAKLALAYHKHGQPELALKRLTDARQIIREESVNGEQELIVRERLLAELASSYATVGRCEEALQITKLMSFPQQQPASLKEIARLCVRSGNQSTAFQAAEMIADSYARVLYEAETSDAFVDSGQLDLADRLLSQALANSELIGPAYNRSLALMEIAVRFARRQQAAAAADILFRALTLVAEIEDNYQQARAFIALADKYREVGPETGERESRILERFL